MKKLVFAALIFILITALCGCSLLVKPVQRIVDSAEELENTDEPLQTVAPTQTVKPSPTPTPTSTPEPKEVNVFVTCDIGYYDYESKYDLAVDYYGAFYDYLVMKFCVELDYAGIKSKEEFLDFMLIPTYDQNGRPKYSFNRVGDYFAYDYVKPNLGYGIESQPIDSFVGYCYRNGKFVDVINHLSEFYIVWRTNEGFSLGIDTSFFYQSWGPMVDTAKFFSGTSAEIRSKYDWPNSDEVSYMLDNIPGVKGCKIYVSGIDEVVLPIDVKRYGYTLDGWYDEDGNKVEIAYSSMSVTARWLKND